MPRDPSALTMEEIEKLKEILAMEQQKVTEQEAALYYTIMPDEDENRLNNPLVYRVTLEGKEVVLRCKTRKRGKTSWVRVKTLYLFR